MIQPVMKYQDFSSSNSESEPIVKVSETAIDICCLSNWSVVTTGHRERSTEGNQVKITSNTFAKMYSSSESESFVKVQLALAYLTKLLLLQGKGKQKDGKVVKAKYKHNNSSSATSFCLSFVAVAKKEEVRETILSFMPHAWVPCQAPGMARTALQYGPPLYQGGEEACSTERCPQIGSGARWR